jgi:hypothetical protein
VFTVEDVKRVQADLGLRDTHVAWVDLDEGFSIAHTDSERESGMDLHDCKIHLWLAMFSRSFLVCCFDRPGLYQVAAAHEVEGLAL